MKNNYGVTRPHFACLAFLALLPLTVESGPAADESVRNGFRVVGQIVSIRAAAQPGSPTLATNIYSVSGFVEADKYVIEILPQAVTEDFNDEYLAWDGSSLGYTTYWPSRQVADVARTNALGHVERQFAPRFGTKHAQALAAALAPTIVVSQFTNNLLLFGTSIIPQQFIKTRIDISADTRKIISMATNILVVNEETHVLPPAYERGFVHWIFEASAVDPQVNLPTDFTFMEHFPKSGRDGFPVATNENDLYTIRSVTGRLRFSPAVTNISAFSPLLRFTGIPVWDHRFRNEIDPKSSAAGIGSLLRRVQRSTIWTVDEETSENPVFQVERSPIGRRRGVTGRDVLITTVVLLVLLAPAILLWWRKTKERG